MSDSFIVYLPFYRNGIWFIISSVHDINIVYDAYTCVFKSQILTLLHLTDVLSKLNVTSETILQNEFKGGIKRIVDLLAREQ